jgi:hypothetical protein
MDRKSKQKESRTANIGFCASWANGILIPCLHKALNVSGNFYIHHLIYLMRTTLTLIIVTILLSFQMRSINKEQIIFDRIEYIFNLKSNIDRQVWKGFNNTEFDVPLIYYTDSSSYIANPTKKFLKSFKPIFVFGNSNIKIYKTINRIDSTLFHMETLMCSGNDSKNIYNYHSPFMNCSSFEVTAQTLPETNSTEYWATMIMHEYFHGFQFRHKAFGNYFLKNLGDVSEDSLKAIYRNNDWFRQKVTDENKYLLKALELTDKDEINKNIDSFFVIRNGRRDVAKQKLNLNLEKYERIYETMEGTARYVEYNLSIIFSNLPPDKKLIKSDNSFHSYDEYKNYKIEPYLYTMGKSYFYVTGFNIVRLLDKLGIEYKTKLFKDGKLSLEQLLLTRNK